MSSPYARTLDGVDPQDGVAGRYMAQSINYAEPGQGETYPPYTQHIPSYGAPGVQGIAVRQGMQHNRDAADLQAEQKIGLPGMSNAIYYSVATDQLGMRAAHMPNAQPSDALSGPVQSIGG